jgi:hypothetical protein
MMEVGRHVLVIQFYLISPCSETLPLDVISKAIVSFAAPSQSFVLVNGFY